MIKNIGIAVLVVLCVAAGYLYKDTILELVARNQVLQERQSWQQRTAELEKTIAQLENDLVKQQLRIEDNATRMPAPVVPAPAPAPVAQPAPAPEKTGDRILDFFDHLDHKGYLPAHGINTAAFEHFQTLVDRLVKSRPIVSGETKDLYTLLKNITYFFRILGKDNVLLIKDILQAEPDRVEAAMGYFFEWVSPWSTLEDPDRIIVPDETMYEYAAFFLHSIAGQSYLFRRTSRIRYLVTYYCIVVLDKANELGLNKYGIDIRPHLDALINDVESHRLLAARDRYLNTLYAIKEKY